MATAFKLTLRKLKICGAKLDYLSRDILNCLSGDNQLVHLDIAKLEILASKSCKNHVFNSLERLAIQSVQIVNNFKFPTAEEAPKFVFKAPKLTTVCLSEF